MFKALEKSVEAFVNEIKLHNHELDLVLDLVNDNFRIEHEDGVYHIYFEIKDNKKQERGK